MARQVLPIAGAIIGGYLGGPQGAQIGFAIGSLVGNAVDPEIIEGPKIGDSGIQTSAEGVFRPVVFGTGALKGNIIVRGNRVIRKQKDQAGKGGGPVTITERVYWTFGIRLCEGPITGVLRIWQDEKLVYDIRPESVIPNESAEFASRFRLHLGDEDQLPDPDLETFQGIGNTHAYRGTAYVVFPNFDLTDYRERIPDFRFEVVVKGPGIQGNYMFGPVAVDGPAGGSERYYMRTSTPTDWATATMHEIPDWMTQITRISTANGVVFMQGGIFEDAAVSFTRGITWQRADSPIDTVHSVTWNGNYYYCHMKRSPDGLTWEAVPNLPDVPGPVQTLSRATDGSVYAFFSSDFNTYVKKSVNDGVSWTTIDTVWTDFSGFATDGVSLHFTVHGNVGQWTPDDFDHYYTAFGDFSMFQPYYGAGIWLRKGFNGRTLRSEDLGVSYDVVLFDHILGADYDNTVLFNDPYWLLASNQPGSPVEWTILYSGISATSFAETPAKLYGNGGNLVFTGGGQESADVGLDYIVSQLHQRAGHSANDYDVSELTDRVDGLVLTGDFTCADAIRTLMPIYFFDSSEYDKEVTGYRINYVKRGKPVVTTVTVDDLLEEPDKTVREDGFERPRALHLHYESPIVGYVPAKATVTRDSPDIKVVGEKSVQVPVSFKDITEPRQIAHKLLKIIWTEIAGQEDMVLGDHLLYLVPGDCIGVSLRGQIRRMRVIQEMIEGGGQSYKLLPDRQSAYTSSLTGIPLPPPTPPPPSIVGQTISEFLDIPALNDGNDRLLYYMAATGQTEAWYGALVQRAVPPDTTWADATAFSLNTVMGTLVNAVSNGSEFYTDTTNVVEVQIYTEDVIEDLTEQQFLSEGGAFALEKADGSWEVMQYQDSVDMGNNTWRLTTLARGRLNSGTSEHAPGSRFVLLDRVRSVDAVTAWLNRNLTHRAISFGTSPDAATPYTDPYVGKSQIEFPVAHLFLNRDTTTISAQAIPRHRFGTETNPVQSVNWLGYRWTATDGVNVANIPDGISPNISFDVAGWSSPITVTVSQVNRFTGAGPIVTEQIA